MKFSRLMRYIPRSLPRFLVNQGRELLHSSPNQQTYLRLFQLKRAHRLMWIQAEGDDNVYQTVILHVDTEEPFILIDDPFPSDGVLEGMVGSFVTLTFNEPGESLCMRCKLLGKASGANSAVYQLSYPEELAANQRREAFRLPVEDSDVIGLTAESLSPWLINTLDTPVSEPVVLDISAAGIRWALLGNLQEDLHAGKLLSGLELSVLGCDGFIVDIDVTHSQWVPDERRGQDFGHTVIGGRFVDILPQTARQLERYITLTQRKQQRDKKGGRLLAA
ncbi:hypothetical protein A9Q99_16340 [Gammaproteobacteria bacterium 45_16_T64]|nr:hypothetical protein A9Q99_16340 [Gammaproteobacteria bacterium 45_16_T64]